MNYTQTNAMDRVDRTCHAQVEETLKKIIDCVSVQATSVHIDWMSSMRISSTTG